MGSAHRRVPPTIRLEGRGVAPLLWVRGIARFACGLSLVALSVGCGRDLERFVVPRYTGPFKPAADYSPVWSHDGRSIAYRRAFASTDGPPGVYIVPSSGGHARLVTGGSFLWPASLRFSPDNRTLVGISDFQLIIIDVATGATNIPMYTNNHAQYPDWSPDGRQIVYNRAFYTTLPPQPLDSAGIHIYDLSSGEDHPIFSDGKVVGGNSSRWSPDGRWIAFLDFGSPQAVKLMHPDGSSLLALTMASPGYDLRNLTWFTPPGTDSEGLLYLESNGNIFFVDPNGGPPTRYQLLYGYDDFSPDGTQFTFIGSQPSDSLGVVFVARVNDFTGETRRQITSFTEPVLVPRAPENAPRSSAIPP